jgi:ribosomal protein S18 acetylase RimI-like enzyme
MTASMENPEDPHGDDPAETSGASLNIRPYEPRDDEQVIRLWQAAFPNDPPRNEPRAVIRRKLRVQRELFLVGEWDGRIVATVLGGYDGFRGWVYHLAVDRAHRRKGFGRLMMREGERLLREMGCPKLNIQVRADNQDVVAFYRRLGYDVEDHISMGKLFIPES